MSTSVKVFQSTDTGAPTLSGTAGSLITLLDACLINGYGSVTLDSLVVASNVATCTKSTGHGFTMLGNVGPVIRISGATPAGLNGDWRITVVSATQFTFTTTGISDQTATGTIVAKRAPLGFSKVFSGTNLAAYRSDDVTGTQFILRVSDDGTGSASYSRLVGYETMTDMNMGTGPFPTGIQYSGGVYIHKSQTKTEVARPWRLIGDGRSFYVLIDNTSGSSWDGGMWFGDLNSFLSTDNYHCGLIGMDSAYGTNKLHLLSSSVAAYLARSYSQVGESVSLLRYAHRMSPNYLGYVDAAYPNPVAGGMMSSPVEAGESAVIIRGLMPGLYCPLHYLTPPDSTVIVTIDGRTLFVQKLSTSYRAAFDITGPWR
jgi:hypothetical protein